jgi:hypothetical protein
VPAAGLLFPALRWSREIGFGPVGAAIDSALRLGVDGFCIFASKV